MFNSIVDTPLFQRLRNIKQNSLARMVYPGLSHSRFEHSLGVAYALMRAIEGIVENTSKVYKVSENRALSNLERSAAETVARIGNLLASTDTLRVAVLAGLLHDVGHLVWSHVFEGALSSVVEIKGKAHERLTVLVADALLREHCPWPDSVCNRALKVLKMAYEDGHECNLKLDSDSLLEENKLLEAADCVIAQLLSSSIDLDRADYVLRDSVHAGVTFGRFDLERLYNTLVLGARIRRDKGTMKLSLAPAILDKGVSTAENLLLNRLYMYNEVYLHNIVLLYNAIAQKYLTLLLLLARQINNCESSTFLCSILNCLSLVTEIAAGKPVSSMRSIEDCMLVLTDSQIEASLNLFAKPSLGRSEISISEKLKEQLKNNIMLTAALTATAYSIVHRRHWLALTLSGRRAEEVYKNLKKFGDLTAKFVKLNKSMFFAVGYRYGFDAVDNVWTVSRLDPLHSVEITDNPLALTIGQLKGRTYAKILFALFIPRGARDEAPHINEQFNNLLKRIEALSAGHGGWTIKGIENGVEKQDLTLTHLVKMVSELLGEPPSKEIENLVEKEIIKSIQAVEEMISIISKI